MLTEEIEDTEDTGDVGLPWGSIRCADKRGLVYLSHRGSMDDTPELRARGELARRCEESGLLLSVVWELRDLVHERISRAKYDGESPKSSWVMLLVGIEKYTADPDTSKAEALRHIGLEFAEQINRAELLSG